MSILRVSQSVVPAVAGVAVGVAALCEASVGNLVAAAPAADALPTLSFTADLRVTTNSTTFVMAAFSELWDIPNVVGAYRSSDGDEGIELVVAAARHGVVSRGHLLSAEDRLTALAQRPVNIRVVALQGRPVSDLASEMLLFTRG